MVPRRPAGSGSRPHRGRDYLASAGPGSRWLDEPATMHRSQLSVALRAPRSGPSASPGLGLAGLPRGARASRPHGAFARGLVTGVAPRRPAGSGSRPHRGRDYMVPAGLPRGARASRLLLPSSARAAGSFPHSTLGVARSTFASSPPPLARGRHSLSTGATPWPLPPPSDHVALPTCSGCRQGRREEPIRRSAFPGGPRHERYGEATRAGIGRPVTQAEQKDRWPIALPCHLTILTEMLHNIVLGI
jgi:hypothetical protein